MPPLSIQSSLGLTLVFVAPGRFMMGTPRAERASDGDEDLHEVILTLPFYLSTTQVTQGQFHAVMGSEPWGGKDNVVKDDQHAASWISWHEATEFSRRLSERDGRGYRLPTEAEWEFACKAGSDPTSWFHFSTGRGDRRELADHAWFADNTADVGEPYPHAVGRKKPNPLGLYDMHGNVHEWCHDWYSKRYVRNSPTTDPKGPEQGEFRVLRGGSWYFLPQHLRSSGRTYDRPETRSAYYGFRIACDLPQA
jgi:sulfatase modifying factor 1